MSQLHIDALSADYSTLIFDLDGTLLDSMNAWCELDRTFLAKRGFSVTDDYSEAVKHMCFSEAAEYTAARYGLDETPEEIMSCWNDMIKDAYACSIRLKPGAGDFLRAASQLGFRIAAATALSHELAVSALRSNGVFELFNAIASLDDVGGKTNKSDPAVYLLAAERAGAADAEECIVFEDISSGIQGAKSGGFPVCCVYDSANRDEWEFLQNVSNFFIIDWEKCH